MHFSVESVDDKGVNLLFFSTLVEKNLASEVSARCSSHPRVRMKVVARLARFLRILSLSV